MLCWVASIAVGYTLCSGFCVCPFPLNNPLSYFFERIYDMKEILLHTSLSLGAGDTTEGSLSSWGYAFRTFSSWNSSWSSSSSASLSPVSGSLFWDSFIYICCLTLFLILNSSLIGPNHHHFLLIKPLTSV